MPLPSSVLCLSGVNILFPDFIQTPSIIFPSGAVKDRILSFPVKLALGLSHSAGEPVPSAEVLVEGDNAIRIAPKEIAPIVIPLFKFIELDFLEVMSCISFNLIL